MLVLAMECRCAVAVAVAGLGRPGRVAVCECGSWSGGGGCWPVWLVTCQMARFAALFEVAEWADFAYVLPLHWRRALD